MRRRLLIAIALACVGVAALLGLLSSRIEPKNPTCPVPSGSTLASDAGAEAALLDRLADDAHPQGR